MSKHDSWIKIDSPSFEPIKHLFPEGVPARDPFPMGLKNNWLIGRIIDIERLTEEQFLELTEFMAKLAGVEVEKIRASANVDEYLCINERIVASTLLGPEGFCRMIEFLIFTSQHQPNDSDSQKALHEFMFSQYDRWIGGNEKPDVHAYFNKLPEELKDEEMIDLYRKFQVEERLNSGGFSMTDILSGEAIVTVLNEIDPESEYSKVTSFEVSDTDRN